MKNILVIGGNSGIGLEIVNRLSRDSDVNLHVASRKDDNLQGIPNLEFQKADVTDDNYELDLPDQLHGLVYCPGTINLKPFHRLKNTDFQTDFDINVMGAVKTLQQAMPAMKKAGNASAVLFSTVAVKLGMPFHASVAVSKAGVEALAKTFSAEYAGSGLRANVIAPSVTDTPLAERLLNNDKKREASEKRHPVARVGTPADMAAAALYLLSDDASWMSGQVLHIDGGMSSLKLL